MHNRYKVMLEGMKKKESSSRKKRSREAWFLYILRCRDGSLYTGITKDISRRVQMHNDGKGARYTRTRKPVKVVYQEKLKNRTAALIRECEIKEYSKQKKEDLVSA